MIHEYTSQINDSGRLGHVGHADIILGSVRLFLFLSIPDTQYRSGNKKKQSDFDIYLYIKMISINLKNFFNI